MDAVATHKSGFFTSAPMRILGANTDVVLVVTAYDQVGLKATVTTHFTFIGFFP